MSFLRSKKSARSVGRSVGSSVGSSSGWNNLAEKDKPKDSTFNSSPVLNTDPTIIGPGYWNNIHLLGKLAVDDRSKNLFKTYMFWLAENFPCDRCRVHIRSYLEDNPLSKFYRIYNSQGIDIGYFSYTVIFHNAVNARINKQIVSFAEAYNLYYKNSNCSSNCALGEDDAEDGGRDGEDENLNQSSMRRFDNKYLIPTRGIKANIRPFGMGK